ncbi:MAG: lipopolysaccharide heptosyltransferase I [Xanthobacteraceae bacterium]|nr:MAG: lipopolysaccharide heptosyltransferase I [Xanthobacteraceae bacterium]
MPEILFIKTSSLGDVIHHMPAVTDARKHFPNAKIAWMVEEAYVPLAKLHPGVNDVIPVAVRRWRKAILKPATFSKTWGEVSRLRAKLKLRRFDKIIDTQGLLKTVLLSKWARGERHGYDKDSIREPLASRFYHVKHAVSRELHAVDRNRALTAAALGYKVEGGPDYGIDRKRIAPVSDAPYALLFHATAQERKEWPEDRWIEVGKMLEARGITPVLPWGNDREKARSERIKAALKNARVPDKAPLGEVAGLIAGATLVAGVDTGLLHLAAALEVPLVAIFVATKPGLSGPVGRGPLKVLGTSGEVPETAAVLDAIESLPR